MTRLALFFLAGLLSSCSSSPALHLPPALEQAHTTDSDARRAQHNGELSRAQLGFAKTLRLQQSLDDSASAATTMINLATVTHQLHDDGGALVWLDKILLEKTALYPTDAILAAGFRKAVILTNLARLSEAETSITIAEKLCKNTCPLRFSIVGLRGRLMLLNGNAQGAMEIAKSLIGNNEVGKEEQSNALRIIATAEEELARYPDALKHYQETLEIDKSLGLSGRIGEDLNGMARVAKKLGSDQEADIYARRAEIVTEALRQK